jgi:hypothetical protein
MRLATWNCCAGRLGEKLAALDTLAADIAVVPELPRPEIPADSTSAFWLGIDDKKGLGVLARPPWRIQPIDTPVPLPRFFQPLQVTGPEEFLLWAVWPMDDRPDRYVRGTHRAIDDCRYLFNGTPAVMLGDFNSNAIWDHEHPAERSHSGLVRKLSGLGLTSAYHAHFREEQGKESRPTYFQYRHEDQPYHIDYCFVPTAWADRITAVTVGGHAVWKRWSDHMPVVVELGP